jgi:hypothetical protein
MEGGHCRTEIKLPFLYAEARRKYRVMKKMPQI